MKFISVKRQIKKEKRFGNVMGIATVNVTYIKKAFLSIPYKTLHKYRETYYGEIKSCEDCTLSA